MGFLKEPSGSVLFQHRLRMPNYLMCKNFYLEIAQVLFLLIFLTADAELDGSLNVPLVTSVDREYIHISPTGVMKWSSNSTFQDFLL